MKMLQIENDGNMYRVKHDLLIIWKTQRIPAKGKKQEEWCSTFTFLNPTVTPDNKKNAHKGDGWAEVSFYFATKAEALEAVSTVDI